MRLIAATVIVLVVFAVIENGPQASTAANLTPNSSVAEQATAVTVQDMAPPECFGMALTNLVSGAGTLTGTGANDLITGSACADVIDGAGGDDCIVGGGGIDDLTGGTGNDVLLGGADDDALDGGGETDSCYGGGQAGDTFNNCSTIVP